MPVPDAFRNFELAGWDNDAVALSYHRNLAEVTSGCIPELIRAAGVESGHKILDVSCGAGYVAAAARDRGPKQQAWTSRKRRSGSRNKLIRTCSSSRCPFPPVRTK